MTGPLDCKEPFIGVLQVQLDVCQRKRIYFPEVWINVFVHRRGGTALGVTFRVSGFTSLQHEIPDLAAATESLGEQILLLVVGIDPVFYGSIHICTVFCLSMYLQTFSSLVEPMVSTK